MRAIRLGVTLLLAAMHVAIAAAPSSSARATNAKAAPPKSSNDAVEIEYQKLLEMDDSAQEDADRWIQEAEAQAKKQDNIGATTLKARIQQRRDAVAKAYEDFLQRHPDHARARCAYGSFLNDVQEESRACEQWEKSLALDPGNAATWNNLANVYGHLGEPEKALRYYLKAIELEPKQSLYYENLATSVFVFRQAATNFFKISERATIEKSLQLYRQALDLDPTNFLLSTHLAESYYGIRAPRIGEAAADRQAVHQLNGEALAAWRRSLELARDEIEREGVRIHLARISINDNQFAQARSQLDAVTNAMFLSTKERLQKNLDTREHGPGAGGSNAEPRNALPALTPRGPMRPPEPAALDQPAPK